MLTRLSGALRSSNGSSTHDCTLEAMRTQGISTAPQKPDQKSVLKAGWSDLKSQSSSFRTVIRPRLHEILF
jgi:hypothetical protein